MIDAAERLLVITGRIDLVHGEEVLHAQEPHRSSCQSVERARSGLRAVLVNHLLDAMVLERMLGKLSSRRHRAGLEPLGTEVEAAATLTSKSAVSRWFVRATEASLAELMEADPSGLDLVAMIDGVHFAPHRCVVALGIIIDGTKVPLALTEGDTENARVGTDLLSGLRERSVDTAAPMLFVLDGAKALHADVRSVVRPPGDPASCQRPRRQRPEIGATIESPLSAHSPARTRASRACSRG